MRRDIWCSLTETEKIPGNERVEKKKSDGNEGECGTVMEKVEKVQSIQTGNKRCGF